jgi:hypothetical protein
MGQNGSLCTLSNFHAATKSAMAQEPVDTKGLLVRLEKAGGLWTIGGQFKHLCNSDPFFFGPPSGPGQNDNRRRQYQVALDNLKRRSPQSYIGLLKLHSVTPATATTDKLGIDAKPAVEDSIAVAEVDFDYGSDEDDEYKPADNDKVKTIVTKKQPEEKAAATTKPAKKEPAAAATEVEKTSTVAVKEKPAIRAKEAEKPSSPAKEVLATPTNLNTLFAGVSLDQNNMASTPPRPTSSVSFMSPSGSLTGNSHRIIVSNEQSDTADGTKVCQYNVRATAHTSCLGQAPCRDGQYQ